MYPFYMRPLNGRLVFHMAVFIQAKIHDCTLRLFSGSACDNSDTEAACAAIVDLYKLTLTSHFEPLSVYAALICLVVVLLKYHSLISGTSCLGFVPHWVWGGSPAEIEFGAF